MHAPHRFPRWLLTPLLLINIGIFGYQLTLTWSQRQKVLVYTLFILISVLAAFVTNSEKIYLQAQSKTLSPPPQFTQPTRQLLVDKEIALAVYSNLKFFISQNPPSSQLSILTAKLADWLQFPLEKDGLLLQAKTADPALRCMGSYLEGDRFQVKCEN